MLCSKVQRVVTLGSLPTGYVRRNGCHTPFHAQQVLAWLVWLVLVTGCFAFYIPLVETLAAKIVVAAVYSLVQILVAASYLYVCLTDPSDPGLKGVPGGESFCDTCAAWVHKRSRHCKECNKCVGTFDHHCLWVNNCIGGRNYTAFFAMLTVVVTMMVVQLAIGAYLFSRCFYAPDATKAALIEAYSFRVYYEGYIAALGFYTAAVAGALYPLAELLLLHIVFCVKGITTLDFIMANKDTMAVPHGVATAAAANTTVLQKLKGMLGMRSRRVTDGGCQNASGQQQQQQQQQGAPRPKQRVPLSACLAWKTQVDTVVLPQQQAQQSAQFDVALDIGKPAPPQPNVTINVHAGPFDPALIFGPGTAEAVPGMLGDEAV